MKKKASIVATILGVSASIYLLGSQTLFGGHEVEPAAQSIKYYDTKCPIGTSDAGYSIKNKPVCEISNIITNDLHLTNDNYWRINGEVQIGGDNNYQSNIIIDKGSVLFGSSSMDFMVVNRGSKIIAKGTKEQPIIFTSDKDIKDQHPKSGDWGGLVIAGNAHINSGNFDEEFEFSKRKIRFGGNIEDDDSGILKYVVIKYAGAQVAKDKELNGLSLGGVGSGTMINYLEVYQGKDDGIELWGGSVNMKHILLIGNRDDSLDTDMGYNGFIQYLYAEKYSIEASETGSGIESDNNEHSYAAEPITNPTLVNFELLGSGGSKYGIVIRRGSGYTLVNGIVSGFDRAQLVINDSQTLANNSLFFQSVAIDAVEADGDVYFAKDGVSEADVTKLFLKGKYCLTNANNTTPSLLNNPFFDKTDFVGAYNPNKDWRFGWSVGVY